jgi:hypothetical protein
MTTYYKVLSKDNKAQNGGDFDYTRYLPKQLKDGTWKAGKWLPKRKTTLCTRGWHVTKYWNMWIKTSEDNVYEVETRKETKEETVGVEEKIVCEQIRLTKKLELTFDNKTNTGHCNTGDRNTGDRNSGDRNSGDRNSGDRNTGYRNTGYSNTGDRNTGDRNTGDRNTGHRNTGNWNTGYRNTGNRNTGDSNTGHRNTGNWNTGNWNTGSYHSGWFNTSEHEAPKLLFGKPYTGTTPNFPAWLYLETPTKEEWAKQFEKAPAEQIQKTIELPNFDYKVFEEITGITKKQITTKLRGKKQ